MVFHFSVADRLIFQTPEISNFCKSFVFLKAIADSDDILRQEIRAGIRRWDNENFLDENSEYFFVRDWFALEDNVLPDRLIHQEFKKMLSFHADEIFANQFFEVIRYPGMGLGLHNTHWMPWTELAKEVRGYLEFINEDVFDALHALGHNSLFSYRDQLNQRLFCILHGPLSYCNSRQDADWDIGFNVRDEDLAEFHFENIFDEIRENCIYWPGEQDEMEVEETFFKFSQNRFYSDFHYLYSGSKYTTEENCIPPVVQVRRKTDLCAAVQLQYYGKPGNPELDDFLQGNCQIMINYDWHNPKGLI
jgi:hypothetical protein